MSNAELIERLRKHACYTAFPKPVSEAADALAAADKRIAELEKEAQFNFEQYQDAGRLLCEANEKLAVAREALRYAGDEPNLDRARRIADAALAQIGECS